MRQVDQNKKAKVKGLAGATIHWQAFAERMIGTAHIGYRNPDEWQELYLVYQSHYPELSRMIAQLM